MGLQNPFNLNWAEENESSSLVSEISNISILVSMMKDNEIGESLTLRKVERDKIHLTEKC